MNPDAIRPDVVARLLVESVVPVAPVSDAARRAPDFLAGQRFQVRVEAQLPNGKFKVLIAEQALQMNLPENVRPGDGMELLLIAKEPRLKFMVVNSVEQRPGEGASLSTTGRFLGVLLHDAVKSPAVPTLTSTAPVLSGPPADSRLLPGLLQQTLSQSGLFYESHQAQWVAGKRTLGQLMQEPQGGLSAAASPQLNRVNEEILSQPSISPEPEAAPAAAVRGSNAPVHEQALTLVQQQLAVLETGQLTWRGEIWPGQWLEWDIAEHPPADSETAEPVRWQTRLRLTLPRLGDVAAVLGLDCHGLHVALSAATAKTAALLTGSQRPLAAAMDAAGLSVLAVEVRHDAGK